MFKRASKSELRTWMIGDLVLFILLIFGAISMFGTFAENSKKVGSLIFGGVLMAIAVICIMFFYRMIIAFQNYEERMEEMERLEAEEKARKEEEDKERILQEEEETKKFVEEYKRKVAEAEEQRRILKEEQAKQKALEQEKK